MTNEEMKSLSRLLDKFITEFPKEHHGSLCGRKMDIAVAESMKASLIAYGIKWEAKITLANGEHDIIRDYTEQRVIDTCERLMKDEDFAANWGYGGTKVLRYKMIQAV